MSPLRIVFPPRKSTRPNSSRFLNNVTVADVEPSQEGMGLPQYTAGACRHGTGGPPPREKLVPGTSGPLSHIMFTAFGVAPDLDKSGATPKAVNMMCESGPLVPGTNFSRGGGPPVPCLQAPSVYWGNPLPSWEGSTSATVTLFKNLELFGLVDFLGGNTILSGDIRASLMSFRNQIAILQANDPILLGYDVLDTRRQPGIVKGGFAKLRQLSA